MLNQLERQFGSWAIPGLIRYLALLFVGVFLLTAINPAFAETLDFDWSKITDGEWWRLLSFIFAPQIDSLSVFAVIFMIFGTMLMFSFSDGLEQQWGIFRTNLFVYWGILSAMLANILYGAVWDVQFGLSGIYLGASILFAFATYNPKYTIMVFMIIPCPIWILAALAGAPMLLSAITSPFHGLFVAICISNYLIIAIPMLLRSSKHRSSTKARRKKFKAYQTSDNQPFHTCHVCGANDISNPEKTFRVGKDGNDYCEEHLPQ
ncbi:hypothetical protein ACFPK9_15035 [Rubritalea spongiae]|uniref:Rhomboid family intramembrane serine protease n=1 Tax=Rubritalea spongiae TaxID=430797 RepID=A0ABW5DYA4_9BACT